MNTIPLPISMAKEIGEYGIDIRTMYRIRIWLTKKIEEIEKSDKGPVGCISKKETTRILRT